MKTETEILESELRFWQHEATERLGIMAELEQTIHRVERRCDLYMTDGNTASAKAAASDIKHCIGPALDPNLLARKKWHDLLGAKLHLLSVIREIRADSKLWVSPKISGQDKYSGLPPALRIIDEALSAYEDPNVKAEPHGYLARSVLLGARSVTSNRVGSSALLGRNKQFIEERSRSVIRCVIFRPLSDFAFLATFSRPCSAPCGKPHRCSQSRLLIN
jgi:hypothetical protein